MQILFGNIKLFIAFFILLIVIIGAMIISLFSSNQTTTPTPQPTTPASSTTPLSSPSPIKVTPGKTTAEEIQKLPGLKQVNPQPDGSTQYEFQSPLVNRDNLIQVNDNLVTMQRNVTVDSSSRHPRLSEYRNLYGEPQQIIQGSSHFGSFETFYIYADKGITVVANPFTEEIDEIYTYQPTTVEDFIKKWGQDIQPKGEETHP